MGLAADCDLVGVAGGETDFFRSRLAASMEPGGDEAGAQMSNENQNDLHRL
jgi:hypothetical protein